MGKIMYAIGRVFQGGAKAFSRFPAAMVSALVVAGAASILIQLETAAHDRILSNLQLAFALGAFLGMALAVLALTRIYRPVLFILANIAALLVSGGVFYLLQQQADQIPEIITARIIAAAAVSFLVFLLVISRDAGRSDYNQSSFMVLKSALIALIYALVIMLGLFFVAFTVQSLLYKDLSAKVYQHIAVWSALGWFAFFLGYFPSFRRDRTDDHLATAQKHPAFIEILFAYVMIPIMAMLTAVLLIWAVRILVVGEWPAFEQLASIFSAYVLFGIFLSIMISHYTWPIASFFRKFFPFAAILFLAFEAYAIYSQVSRTGIKTQEYFISLIWIYALIAAILFIILPVFRSHWTAWAAIILIIAAVLPVTGYQALPVAAQVSRLQQVLIKNDMLSDSRIQIAPASITLDDKVTITDATNFLLRDEGTVKARWFSDSISRTTAFKSVYGFDLTYADSGITVQQDQYTYINLPNGFINISDYQFAASVSQSSDSRTATITGQKGTYIIKLNGLDINGKPQLSVTRDGASLLEQDLTPWLNALNLKYRGTTGKGAVNVAYEDMLLKTDQSGVSVLIVFSSIEITEFANSQKTAYNMAINSVYLKEN